MSLAAKPALTGSLFSRNLKQTSGIAEQQHDKLDLYGIRFVEKPYMCTGVAFGRERVIYNRMYAQVLRPYRYCYSIDGFDLIV